MFTSAQHTRSRPIGVIASLAAVCLTFLAAACGSGTSSKEAAPAAAAVAAPPVETHEAHAGGSGRVFFVEPKDGASVKSPVHFEFSAENFTISPVPEGTVEHSRDGMGHFHLGVEGDCLPAGELIPKGTPGWVHFGKGDKTIDMQLAPGAHKFSLQAGDDQHRTVAGLCQTLSITVTP